VIVGSELTDQQYGSGLKAPINKNRFPGAAEAAPLQKLFFLSGTFA
jgi:hypothetical protein